MDDKEEERLRAVEVGLSTLQMRVGIIQAVVFGVVGLICSSVIVALVALVVVGGPK